MERITKLNFQEHYQDIKEHILEADTIAFDCEFSGLRYRHPLYPRTCAYDLDQEIYERYAHVGERYSLYQVGITTFKLTQNHQAYTQKTYSFFLHQQG